MCVYFLLDIMTPLDVLLLSYIKGCFVYCPFLPDLFNTTLGGKTMVKSNYGQIKKYENEILAMKEAGYTKRRIAEELALTKEQMLPLSPGYCKWLS